MIRICRQFFLEGHGERTIPKRCPNDTPKHNLRALGRRSPTHPRTWTKHWHTKCLGATFHISWVEAIAWKEEKKNQTKEPNKATSFQHHHGNVHLKMQIRWIDQIQYPISLVASLDTVPVICWNSTSFTSIGKVHAHTHTQTNKHRISFLQCSPEKRPFSSSTFGRKDFKCGEWGAFVEFGPSSYALFIAGRKTWNATGDVIVTRFHVGMPPRANSSEKKTPW